MFGSSVLNNIHFSLFAVASVAGGIVGAREVKFWWRSREKYKVPLPILLAASPLACWFRRQNFISRALTIPPATQAMFAASFPSFIPGICQFWGRRSDSFPVVSRSLKGAGVNWGKLIQQGITTCSRPRGTHWKG